MEPLTEKDPLRQSPVGEASPVEAQYFPAGQGVHKAEPAAPKENEPEGHVPLTEERPKLEQNFPASQL